MQHNLALTISGQWHAQERLWDGVQGTHLVFRLQRFTRCAPETWQGGSIGLQHAVTFLSCRPICRRPQAQATRLL